MLGVLPRQLLLKKKDRGHRAYAMTPLEGGPCQVKTLGCLCSTDTVAVTVILRVPPEVVFSSRSNSASQVFSLPGIGRSILPDVFGGIMGPSLLGTRQHVVIPFLYDIRNLLL